MTDLDYKSSSSVAGLSYNEKSLELSFFRLEFFFKMSKKSPALMDMRLLEFMGLTEKNSTAKLLI